MVPARRPDRAGRRRSAGPTGAARRRHRALRAGGGRRSRHPGPVPRGAGRGRAGRGHGGVAPSAGRARSGRGRSDGAEQPAARGACPRGHPRQRAAVLQLRARTRRPRAHGVPHRRPRPLTRGLSRPASTSATPRSSRPASSTRCGGCAITHAASRGPPRRRSATRSSWPTSTATEPSTRPSTSPSRRTRRFARRQRAWFRRDPRIAWLDADEAGDDGLNPLVDALAAAVG